MAIAIEHSGSYILWLQCGSSPQDTISVKGHFALLQFTEHCLLTSPQGPQAQSTNHIDMTITATVFLLVASFAYLAWAAPLYFPEERAFQVTFRENYLIAV